MLRLQLFRSDELPVYGRHLPRTVPNWFMGVLRRIQSHSHIVVIPMLWSTSRAIIVDAFGRIRLGAPGVLALELYPLARTGVPIKRRSIFATRNNTY